MIKLPYSYKLDKYLGNIGRKEYEVVEFDSRTLLLCHGHTHCLWCYMTNFQAGFVLGHT
jgi:hypothetical protein